MLRIALKSDRTAAETDEKLQPVANLTALKPTQLMAFAAKFNLVSREQQLEAGQL
jgi:hypothetical protein